MPTSAAGSDDAGFTLIELMVVITIIAVASAAVMLALPDPRGRLVDEATRFAGRVRAAHDEAVVDAKPVSLWVSPAGYGFDRRLGGAWSPADAPLRVERWADGTTARLRGVDRTRVTFDETGLADRPLDVPLQRGRQSVHIRIAADGSVLVGD